MGCGASSGDITQPVTEGVLGDMVKTIDNLGPAAITSAKQLTQEVLEGPILGRPQDEKRTVARTGTEGTREPPNGEVVDGLLGTSNEEEIEAIKKTLVDGTLFEDSKFPISSRSLFYSKKRGHDHDVNITWLRPKEFCSEPKLVMDSVSKKDVVQGQLGDCWFLSACAALTQRPQLLKKVIPKDQVLYGKGYTGLIVFHFWRFGRWVIVYVDDRLPTRNGNLIYARCSNTNEFWVPLLEKAYAKLHDSYEALVGGQAKDALVDLTGGLAECYSLKDVPEDFYRRLHRAYIKGAFITCARNGEWDSANTVDEKGLVSGHAYTVTCTATVPTKSGKYVDLIRIRNPWGDGSEWNGNWSDSSNRWKEISETIKKNLQVKNSPDGEFWMSYNDFREEFRDLTICTLGPESGLAPTSCEMQMVRGSWELGKTCGGSRNNVHKFAQNPQYKMTISDIETFEDEVMDLSGRRSVVISLMQEHRRSKNKYSLKMAHIAFVIYKGDESSMQKLPPEYFLINHDLGMSGPHVNFREVTARFQLVPGSYVIIPSTYEDNCPRPFLLRIYCDCPFVIRELKEKPLRGWEKPSTQKTFLQSLIGEYS